MRFALLFIALLSSGALFADGKTLHDAACLQCHASLSAGDPHQLYERSDRKVKSVDTLRKRVAYCAKAADVTWDKTQQEAVVQYLRDQFYQF